MQESDKQQSTNELPILPENEIVFEKYRVWKSLPALSLKGVTREILFQQAGIDDEEVLDLLKIKTQQDFAAQFNLSRFTLTNWNKIIDDLDPLVESKGWARKLAKNMVMALYAHAIRKGDPSLMKLFFQVVNEWSEKSTVEHDFPQITEFNISLIKKDGADNKKEGDQNKLANDGSPSGSVPSPVGPGN